MALDWQADARAQAQRSGVVKLVFAAGERPEIPAEFIVSALTGVGPDTSAVRRLEIEGATLTGELDLAHGRSDSGAGLGALILRDCWIPNVINAENAHLRTLVLENSRILHLKASNLRVDGDLDLSGVESVEDALGAAKTGAAANSKWRNATDLALDDAKRRDQAMGRCWVELRHAQIGGALVTARACFVAPIARKPEEYTHGRNAARYALDLQAVRIGAGGKMMPGMCALGGINLQDAVIHGDIWMNGAVLDCCEGFALRAQSAQISGVLSLDAWDADPKAVVPFVARGGVWLLAARLGSLHLTGGRFAARQACLDRSIDDNDRVAFAMDRAHVADQVSAAQTRVTEFTGATSFGLAEINRDFRLDGALIASEFGMWLPKKVGGHLSVVDLRYRAPANKRLETAILGAGMSVGASLRFVLSAEQDENSVTLNLSRASVRGETDINRRGLRLLNIEHLDCGNSLRLVGRNGVALRDGPVLGQSIQVMHDCIIENNVDAKIDLSNMVCRGSVVLENVTFLQPQPKDASRIYDDAQIYETDDDGRVYLILNHAVAAKALRLNTNVQVATQMRDATPAAIRTQDLSFYPGWRIVEALVVTPKGDSVLSLLEHKKGIESPIVLDGKSPPIHRLNASGALKITDENVIDYLKFFGASVWGDDGAFNIVDQDDNGPYTTAFNEETLKKVKDPKCVGKDGEDFLVEATVAYAHALFTTQFKIARSGMVDMLSDEPLGTRGVDDGSIIYAPPYRRARKGRRRAPNEFPIPPAFGRSDAWRLGAKEELNILATQVPNLGGEEKPAHKQFRTPIYIDLVGMQVATLEDDHGALWTPKSFVETSKKLKKLDENDPIRLDLRGFEYKEASSPKLAKSHHQPLDEVSRLLGVAQSTETENARARGRRRSGRHVKEKFNAVAPEHGSTGYDRDTWKKRRIWLARQFRGRDGNGNHDPQPFEELERAYMRQGDFENATGIRAHRAHLEVLDKARSFTRLFSVFGLIPAALTHAGGFIAWATSRYALDPWRALSYCIAFWLVGWAAVEYANFAGILALDVQPVHDVYAPSGPSAATQHGQIACGDEIVPALYALDVFVPLLDLQQENRCDVGDNGRVIFDLGQARWQMNLWEVLRGGYMIVGWMMLSLTIFTFSRVMQRRARQV